MMIHLAKHKIKVLSLVWCLLLGGNGYASSGEEGGGKTPSPKAKTEAKVIKSLRPSIQPAVEGSAAPAQVQLELDAAVAKLQEKMSANVIVPDNLADVPVSLTAEASEDRVNANKMFRYLEKNPDKIFDMLRIEHLTQLPVGIRFPVTKESEALLGILKVEFKPDHAELTVFLRYKFHVKDSDVPERDLFLGAEGIRFTKEGGLQNTFKVSLLGDFVLPMKSWTLIMKGGLGIGDSDYSKTYAEINCGDLVGGSVQGQILFPRSVLKPFDEATHTVIEDGRVELGFQAAYTKQTLLKDILVGVTFPQPFCVAGFEKWGFKIQNASYDHSDLHNPVNDLMPFPDKYQGVKDKTWKGIYLGNVEVLLPKAFKKYSDESKISKVPSCGGTSLGGKNILIDPTGFTGVVYYNKASCTTAAEDVSAQRWKVTLDRIELTFLQNEFQKGEFGGRVSIPITDPDIDGNDGMLTYNGIIGLGGNYTLSVAVVNNIPYKIRVLRAKGTFKTGTVVNLEVINDTFYPNGNFNGTLEIESDANNSITHASALQNGTNSNADAKFTGLEFYNLSFQTKDNTKPYVAIEDFKYDNPNGGKILNFPVAITWLQKYREMINGQLPGANDLWIGLGLRLDVGKKNALEITGSTKLLFRTTYDPTKGRLVLQGVNLLNLYVKGDGPALYVEGYLNRKETAAVKEWAGGLKIAIKKPNPMGFEMNVIIGRWKGTAADRCGLSNEYNYGYFDFYAGAMYEVVTQSDGNLQFNKAISTVPTLIPVIPTGIGDLCINGGGIGVYWNMKPFPNPTASASNPQVFKYEPCYQVPFGLKAMLGFQGGPTNKPPYRGRFNLDISFDRSYGINQVALYGNMVTTGDFAKDLKVDAVESLGESIKNKGQDVLTNLNPAPTDANDLIKKAEQQNAERGITKANQEAKVGSLMIAAGVLLDIPNATFHLEGHAFIKQGSLEGKADAVLHIGKEFITTGLYVFYLRVGRPYPFEDRARIGYYSYGKNGKDKFVVEANGYLWIGYGVPAFPPPPNEILNTFPQLRNRLANVNYTSVRGGTAFAFGAMGKVELVDDGWAGSISVLGIAGFDVLMSNNSRCNPNGFYGQGQLYGLVDIRAKAGPFRADLGAGIYFYANFLKPTGVDGCVYIRIRTPWPLKDIELNPCFTVGTICRN